MPSMPWALSIARPKRPTAPNPCRGYQLPDRIGRFLLQPPQDQESGVGGLGLDQQMKMLGHEHPADQQEMPLLPHFLKALDKTATESVGEEECRAMLGAAEIGRAH